MSNKLKIASWNIDLKRKKDDKFIHIINDLLDNNEIVVLNEVCFKHKEIIDKIANERKNMFDYVVNKVNDVGYIMMFISKTRFEHIIVDNDYCLFGMSIIDVLASNAKNEMVRILGVRLHTQLHGNEFKTQLKDFINMINDKKPDIVIGDFNWKTTIGTSLVKVLGNVRERKQTDQEFSQNIIAEIVKGKDFPIINKTEELENQFCELINYLSDENNYNIFPFERKGEETYSVCALIRHKKYYSKPDRLMWNENKIRCDSVVYEPELVQGEEFPNDWPSDHSIIKASLYYQ